jgi:hypothetical protein
MMSLRGLLVEMPGIETQPEAISNESEGRFVALLIAKTYKEE